MGYGFTYKCKCGHEYSVSSGIGYMYPLTCKEELEKIENGEYGEDWKQAAIDCGPNLKIGIENKVFMCSDCNTWEELSEITLYKPINNISKDNAQYFMSGDEGYKAYKRTVYNCPQCGKKMKTLSEEDLNVLPCPICGEFNERETDLIMWD